MLSSGSVGNCILVYDCRGKCVVLDVGIRWDDVLKGLDYDLSCVSLALVSHRHHDHTKSLSHCIAYGIPCYANDDVCGRHKGCGLIGNGMKIAVDGWGVQCFDLVHNVPNKAFVLDAKDGIRVLYCTDTESVPKVVKNVNYAVIECNYDNDILIDNLANDEMVRSQFQNHHSLGSCIAYLKRIYNPDMQGIILSHISPENGKPEYFRRRVQEELGFENVYTAERGQVIPLQKSEF